MSSEFPCARCGRPVRRVAASRTQPRRIACPRCRYLIYDYPRACAGALVLKGDAVLLLRRAHAPRIGSLDVPGGFLEAGESIEGSARRELREETGLTVARMELLGLYWDEYELAGFGRFPTLNWYYVARWRAGTPVAADDAASAEWIPLERVTSLRAQYAWAHMPGLFRDLKRWVGAQRAASPRARSSRSAMPSSAAQRSR